MSIKYAFINRNLIRFYLAKRNDARDIDICNEDVCENNFILNTASLCDHQNSCKTAILVYNFIVYFFLPFIILSVNWVLLLEFEGKN